MRMESGSCCDELKKGGVIVLHIVHGNLFGWDHVEQKHNHVLQDHVAKNQQPEYVHKTSPLCPTSHLGHNKEQPLKENTDFGCVGKDGAVRQRNIIELNVCIDLYQLFMEEASNEVWKVRNVEMDTETANREWEISNCTIAQ